MPAKFDYMCLAPVTPKGKHTICVRRVGTRDRYAPVAEARTQTAADSIVDALNLMQGEVKKLEVPAQRELEGVRRDLQTAHERNQRVSTEKGTLEHRLREAERSIDRITQERNLAQSKLKAAEERATSLQERNDTQSQTISEQDATIKRLTSVPA